MHFRVRGNHVQIVKPVEDASGKKNKSKPVGSMNLTTGELNEVAKVTLSPAEVAEAQAWLASHKAAGSKRQELEVATLAERMNDVAKWLRQASAADVALYSEGLGQGMRQLRAALNRATGAEKPAGRKAGA